MTEHPPPYDPHQGQQPPYDRPPQGQPAHGQPQQYYPAPGPPTPGSATTALVLGVLSLACFGFLTGIPAMVVGRSAKREIEASGGRLGGEGVATAGFVTGLVGTVLSVVALLGLVLFFLAVGLTVNETFGQVDDLQPAPSGPCTPGADPFLEGCEP